MSAMWHKPTYLMKAAIGKDIVIDVTLSSSSGLPPHKVIRESVIPFFRERRVETVLDFGGRNGAPTTAYRLRRSRGERDAGR